MATGTTSAWAAAAAENAPMWNGQESRIAPKSPFHEHDQRSPGAQVRFQLAFAGGRLVHVVPFDEDASESPEQGAEQRRRGELSLRHERNVGWQCRHEEQGVDVARVIGDDDDRSRPRDMLGPDGRRRYPGEPHGRTRGHAPEPGRAAVRGSTSTQRNAAVASTAVAAHTQGTSRADGYRALRRQLPDPPARRAQREAPRELAPQGARPARTDQPALVRLATGRAADLATRCLQNGVRRGEHHLVQRDPMQIDGQTH